MSHYPEFVVGAPWFEKVGGPGDYEAVVVGVWRPVDRGFVEVVVVLGPPLLPDSICRVNFSRFE